MPRYIRKERLKAAIQALAQWRANTQAQASAHLFPFLALIEKGVNANEFKRFEESDDFSFWDRYFRVPGSVSEPYFDPLTLQRRIDSHPHSNPATLRKNTFQNRWHAAESRDVNGQTQWKLAPTFADIIVDRVMTRAGDVTRPNVIDIAAWLFRKKEFADNATARDLQSTFRQTFSLPDEVYNKLFVFREESPENIFTSTQLTDDEIREVVESTMPRRAIPVPTPPPEPEVERSALAEDDAVLAEVRAVMAINSSGIIFRGCPGTGKTWYAWNVGLVLTDNKPQNIHRVQFHPSYGYEDFVEGYRPNDTKTSGFEIVDREFLSAVDKASKTNDTVVFIVDEINRGDPSRIFGEVLTYVEHGWRDMEFSTPYSGQKIKIPKNLVLLATMNPHDRSITQLDMAMLRRFDHIDILPSKERVDDFLSVAGMESEQSQMVVKWFDSLQRLLPYGIGHTYFLGVGDIGKLVTVWRYRILPYCESALEFEPERLTEIKRSFDGLEARLRGQSGGE